MPSRAKHLTRTGLSLVALLLCLPLGAYAAATTPTDKPPRQAMTLTQGLILGVVEGLTEYLPVSSTAHLLLTQNLMGIGKSGPEKDAGDSYQIVIQAGAILAVLWLYFGRVRGVVLGVFGRDPQGLRMAFNLLAGFLPAAIIGLTFEKAIKHYLFGMQPIVLAWFVGGMAILLVSWFKRPDRNNIGMALDDLYWKQALIIGLAQCLAMWPGTSRSLITIVGGLLVGLSVPAAVEFSFLLGLVTLGAATSYEALKSGGTIIATFGWQSPLAGFVASFVSGVAAVKWMVSYLNRHPLDIFGYYRVALAVVVGLMIYDGMV